MLVSPESYRRKLRLKESLRSRAGRNVRSRRSSLNEYRVSDFKKDGMKAQQYITDQHATDRRVKERVYVNEPVYLGISDSWKNGRMAPLVIHTCIENNRGKVHYQDLAIKGFWWNLVNRLIDDGALLIDDNGDYKLAQKQKITRKGNIKFVLDRTRLQNILTSILKYAVDPKESAYEFAGRCSCPDFIRHGSNTLSQKGALLTEKEDVLDIDWEGVGPGCKHLYKVCLRTSDFSGKIAKDVVRVLNNPAFLEMVASEFLK